MCSRKLFLILSSALFSFLPVCLFSQETMKISKIEFLNLKSLQNQLMITNEKLNLELTASEIQLTELGNQLNLSQEDIKILKQDLTDSKNILSIVSTQLESSSSEIVVLKDQAKESGKSVLSLETSLGVLKKEINNKLNEILYWKIGCIGIGVVGFAGWVLYVKELVTG